MSRNMINEAVINFNFYKYETTLTNHKSFHIYVSIDLKTKVANCVDKTSRRVYDLKLKLIINFTKRNMLCLKAYIKPDSAS